MVSSKYFSFKNNKKPFFLSTSPILSNTNDFLTNLLDLSMGPPKKILALRTEFTLVYWQLVLNCQKRKERESENIHAIPHNHSTVQLMKYYFLGYFKPSLKTSGS